MKTLPAAMQAGKEQALMARSGGTWTKGRSGNPLGGALYKQSPTVVLRAALAHPHQDGGTTLDFLITKAVARLVRDAEAGELTLEGLAVLFSRLDGAPPPNTALLEAREAQVVMHEVLPLFRGRGYTPEMLAGALTVLRAAVSSSESEDDGGPVQQVNGAATNGALHGLHGALTVGQRE